MGTHMLSSKKPVNVPFRWRIFVWLRQSFCQYRMELGSLTWFGLHRDPFRKTEGRELFRPLPRRLLSQLPWRHRVWLCLGCFRNWVFDVLAHCHIAFFGYPEQQWTKRTFNKLDVCKSQQSWQSEGLDVLWWLGHIFPGILTGTLGMLVTCDSVPSVFAGWTLSKLPSNEFF